MTLLVVYRLGLGRFLFFHSAYEPKPVYFIQPDYSKPAFAILTDPAECGYLGVDEVSAMPCCLLVVLQCY